jgi:hypothetical protein
MYGLHFEIIRISILGKDWAKMNDLGCVAEGENLFPTQYIFALLEITHHRFM